MTVSILILTHDLVGSSLLKAATRTMGNLSAKVIAMPVCNDCEPEKILEQTQSIITGLQKDGFDILILTDLYGSTPFNIAQYFNNGVTIRVISGINLSMLLRVLNYVNLDLHSLCEKALTGGKDGVISCENVSTTVQALLRGQINAIENVSDY